MIEEKLKDFEGNISLLMMGDCPQKVFDGLYNEIESIILYSFMYLRASNAQKIKNNLLELRLIFVHLEKKDFNLSNEIINEIVNTYNFIESIIKKGE